MSVKRISLLAIIAAGLVLANAGWAASPPSRASLVIRHQTKGCHAWAVDGGAYKARQSITLSRHGSVTITNNDVMPHTLVLTSGPRVRIAHPTLAHMMASLTITLTRPGVYHFTTKAGEDYMAGITTTGPDNVLRLTVVVT